jgi:hypothetical protein
VSGKLAYLYRVENGKVAHVTIFPTRELALEAAGSPE